jgi:hypothetical protein
MRLPKMNATERAVFAALYAVATDHHANSVDNANAEAALDEALWELKNFRQAVRSRKDDE